MLLNTNLVRVFVKQQNKKELCVCCEESWFVSARMNTSGGSLLVDAAVSCDEEAVQ